MNKVIMMGRLTKDPEVRYGGSNNTAIARYTIAVDRRFKREGQPTADFFNCTTFGKPAEFVEKYLRKGTKVVIEGELQNDNYTGQDGKMVYGMRIIVSAIEFAESKRNASDSFDGDVAGNVPAESPNDGFMNIPDGIEDELPFA